MERKFVKILHKIQAPRRPVPEIDSRHRQAKYFQLKPDQVILHRLPIIRHAAEIL